VDVESYTILWVFRYLSDDNGVFQESSDISIIISINTFEIF